MELGDNFGTTPSTTMAPHMVYAPVNLTWHKTQYNAHVDIVVHDCTAWTLLKSQTTIHSCVVHNLLLHVRQLKLASKTLSSQYLSYSAAAIFPM